MEFVADSDRNPFGMDPPCERSVPGYGDTSAHFHVIGDNPARHGGLDTGIPFTDRPWSAAFFDALARGGLVEGVDLEAGRLDLDRTFLSYLHMCDPGEGEPTESDYATLEPFFDAALRAVTAHVLLPVGDRAIEHILATCTSKSATAVDADAVHATEVHGSGWLVIPVKEPATWTDADAEALAQMLTDLLASDYRQTADLGRFLPDEESHLVR
ncbi:uracil-DNA glycosylase family protein [Salinibaculum rarum]|uniref:uracil-DNA glycosylase family protein n=1 Tax=Salinibaculum rarum TaxID=3058903 RepID=UPI0034E9516B